MTDHRVTDLSYGHLGEASYDVDEKSWNFSTDLSLESSIAPLHALQECIPPSMQSPPDSTKTASKVRHLQERWIRKALPETGPAKTTIMSIAKAPTSDPSARHPSTLLALGKAVDIDRTTGTRSIQIMAMVHGEAGNLLRLIKPQVEAFRWESSHGTKLRSLNPVAGEDCYWLGSGGAIRQITFGSDSYGFTSWLAVLKADSITILRPIYSRIQTPSSVSVDTGRRNSPSHLNPNPILSLSSKRTGARPHADVSFNPWYIRQFAVIDQQGYWSIWDIEGQKKKRTTLEAKHSKSGHIQDNLPTINQDSRSTNSADGWGRVLWAGGVSTLIMCDRRNLTLFDLRATPRRLHSPEVLHPNSIDWILDMRRSPVNFNYIFVLTTRQIFWLQVVEAGDEQDEQFGHAGAKIILSCQHFRNHEDETAKLELLGENEGCTALLYSAQSPIVNTYRFSMAFGDSTRPICSQGSFIIESSKRDQTEKSYGMVQTLCLLPTTFMTHNLKPMSGPAKKYADHNVCFYQLFGLSETLGLYHTLCATKWTTSGNSNSGPINSHNILAPTIKDGRVGKIKSSLRVIEDQFIVLDGLEDDDEALESFNSLPYNLSKPASSITHQDNMRQSFILSIDARRWFKVSFLEKYFEESEDSLSPEERKSMVAYSKALQCAVEEKKNSGFQGLLTFLELVEYASFSDDIDEAASALGDLMNALTLTAEAPGTMNVTPMAIKPSPFMQNKLLAGSVQTMPDLSEIYDRLVELWVSCLPGRTPGQMRLAKEKLVRGVATELCLCSLGVSFRDKSVILPKPRQQQERADFVLPVRAKPDVSDKFDGRSHPDPSNIPVPSLPTPAATPSLPSNDSTTSLSEPVEDGAISRLRGYTLSIKSQPPLRGSRSTILAHWPSIPGADPLQYSWEISRQSVAEDEDIDHEEEEEALLRQKEQNRRRRRTEKFLKRQRVNTIDTASQPLPALAFGSQPEPPQHPVISQAADTPMTQPDRGAFGSRIGPKGFKKRRTMGF